MINIKELRIGNLVKADNAKIWNEDYNNSIVEVDIDILLDIFRDESLFSPIPLTPELLKQCGFERHDLSNNSQQYYTYTKVAFTFNSLHGWWYYNRNLDIQPKYLHQLQNLFFALTGTELEITTLVK
jgi:hypothetical protein